MKHVGLWAIGIGVLVSGRLLAVEQAHSQLSQGQQGGATTCSLATLNGLYMFAQSGYLIIAGSAVPQDVTGMDTFHGDGTFDSLATISTNGFITPDDAAPGTYTVKEDCTGTVTIVMKPPVPDVHLDIFIKPNGDEFFTIETDPGTVLGGTIRRVAP